MKTQITKALTAIDNAGREFATNAYAKVKSWNKTTALSASAIVLITTSVIGFFVMSQTTKLEDVQEYTFIKVPAENVEITNTDGDTITATILELKNLGIEIRTPDGEKSFLLWGSLNEDTQMKIRRVADGYPTLPFETFIFRKKNTNPEINTPVFITKINTNGFDTLNHNRENGAKLLFRHCCDNTVAMLLGTGDDSHIVEWQRKKDEAEAEKEHQSELQRQRRRNITYFFKDQEEPAKPNYGRNAIIYKDSIFINGQTFPFSELCDQSVAFIKEEIDDSFVQPKIEKYLAYQNELRKQTMHVRLDGKIATAQEHLPKEVHKMVAAGNALKDKGYRVGGGHGNIESNAYDCSGAVSYLLIKAGLLDSPLTSEQFMEYGTPGNGKYITIWSKPGHVFLMVGGLRFDTGDSYIPEDHEPGPRWKEYGRDRSGFVHRHPPGHPAWDAR